MMAVRSLLKDPRINPSIGTNNAIRIASRKGFKEIVEILLKDNRVNPSARNNEAIRLASKRGHKEVVKMLLQDHRINLNEAIRYASTHKTLLWASKNNHSKIVDALLKDDVDPMVNNNEAIRVAIENGHKETVEVFLRSRAEPYGMYKIDDRFIMRVACKNGQKEIVQMLLKDPYVRFSDYHDEAIHLASQNGHKEIVKILQQDTHRESKRPRKF
jgi:ankyrin repeat protein